MYGTVGYSASETKYEMYARFTISGNISASTDVEAGEAKTEINNTVKNKLDANVDESTIKKAVENIATKKHLEVNAADLSNDASIITNKLVEEAKKKLKATEDDKIEIAVKPYLDVAVSDYKSEDDGTAELEYKIEAKYDIVAEKDADSEKISNENPLNVTEPFQIKLPLTKDFEDKEYVYIRHEKSDGREFVYNAKVVEEGSELYAVFTNPNGFSEFTVTADKPIINNGQGTTSTDTPSNVIVKDLDNGKISVDTAVAGEKVTLTVTPDKGYELKSITATANGKKIELTKNADGTYSFVMPNGDVEISAEFTEITVKAAEEKKDTALKVNKSIFAARQLRVNCYAGGEIDLPTRSFVQAGDTVTINITPDEGYSIAKITVNGKAVDIAESIDVKVIKNTVVNVTFAK